MLLKSQWLTHLSVILTQSAPLSSGFLDSNSIWHPLQRYLKHMDSVCPKLNSRSFLLPPYPTSISTKTWFLLSMTGIALHLFTYFRNLWGIWYCLLPHTSHLLHHQILTSSIHSPSQQLVQATAIYCLIHNSLSTAESVFSDPHRNIFYPVARIITFKSPTPRFLHWL